MLTGGQPTVPNCRQGKRYFFFAILLAAAALFGGCGTTRWTDTSRTATEQLLLSDAMDRAVSQVDFRALAGRTVYLDSQPVQGMTDAPYLVSTLRQQLLANGCILKEKREEADYIVELRAGALGTDRHDILFGVPATQLPSVFPMNGVPTSIPEIPFIKRTQQHGVAKIAVFAYNRTTGRPAWQSGVVASESKAKSIWVFGAGPFQRGTIYEGTTFAGSKLDIPLIYPGQDRRERLSVADEAFFAEPSEEFAQKNRPENSASGEKSGVGPQQAAGLPASNTPPPETAPNSHPPSAPQTARPPAPPSGPVSQ
ncbi:MAG TPA: hypothetical protein PK777_08550 [Thermoguttaceae bacterium]|nr:hypothetical protein [Thermoguttaceae bacterium]